jgi:hypothetical protein
LIGLRVEFTYFPELFPVSTTGLLNFFLIVCFSLKGSSGITKPEFVFPGSNYRFTLSTLLDSSLPNF